MIKTYPKETEFKLPNGDSCLVIKGEEREVQHLAVWNHFDIMDGRLRIDMSGLEKLFAEQYKTVAEQFKKPSNLNLFHQNNFYRWHSRYDEKELQGVFWGLMLREYTIRKFLQSPGEADFINNSIQGLYDYYTRLKYPAVMDFYRLGFSRETLPNLSGRFLKAIAEEQQDASLILGETNFHAALKSGIFGLISASFWERLNANGHSEKEIFLSSEDQRKKIAQSIVL